MPIAIGTSLQVIVLNCLAGFAGYAGHVAVDPRIVGAVAAAAVVGSLAGTRLARRVDPATLRRGFAAFVLVMASVILVREADLWMTTAAGALPTSVPQIVFALLMLAIGLFTGRVSRDTRPAPRTTPRYIHGDGI
jgi:uncharacterized membrane protein YfcA